jgi:hypothetical protein
VKDAAANGLSDSVLGVFGLMGSLSISLVVPEPTGAAPAPSMARTLLHPIKL